MLGEGLEPKLYVKENTLLGGLKDFVQGNLIFIPINNSLSNKRSLKASEKQVSSPICGIRHFVLRKGGVPIILNHL